jgi:cation-transporting ATPase I
MQLVRLPARFVQLVEQMTAGRRHRRAWVFAGRAHIEVRGLHLDESGQLAEAVKKELCRLEGVKWAQVNEITGRVAVLFDPEGISSEDLIDALETVEKAHGTSSERFGHEIPELPGDTGPIRRNRLAIAADLAGLGASIFGQLLQASPLPSEIASLIALAENEPRARRFLEHRFGPAATDLGLGMASALSQAIAQGPIGLVVDVTHRANVLSELKARARLWERREPDLTGPHRRPPHKRIPIDPRPTPLRSGPVETYADKAALAAMAGFGATLAFTGSPRRAANMFTAGLPKAPRLGRESFAAGLDRNLSRHGVIVMDTAALRRLDRIHAVLLDERILFTGRREIIETIPLGDQDPAELFGRARALFDTTSPQRSLAKGAWRIGNLEALALRSVRIPRGVRTKMNALAKGEIGALGLAHRGTMVGIVLHREELDPFTEPLCTMIRRLGYEAVVAGKASHAARFPDCARVPGASRLYDSLRSLQEDGKGVLLIAGGEVRRALRAADIGFALVTEDDPTPWGAHVLGGSSLADAMRLIEAMPSARKVSSHSALIGLVGSSLAAASVVTGPSTLAGARAALPVNLAALTAQARGALEAHRLSRHPDPVPPSKTPWHAIDPKSALEALGSSTKGISANEARRRMDNKARKPPVPLRLARAIAAELANPLTPILAAGAGVSALVGSIPDAVLVAGVAGTNALLGGIQRVRTEVSVNRLMQESSTKVTIRRPQGGTVKERPERVARGDVIELFAGDMVPADCRILEADSCEVDESTITGEPFPVSKDPAAVPGAPVAERSCMLYEGTTIVNGSALAVVTATGEQTEIGKSLADAPPPPPSGVETRLQKLTSATLPVTLLSGAGVSAMSLLRGRGVRDAVTSGVGLTVAAVPEGLPVLATVAQLAAARRLASRGAMVRNPRTIEALGRVDVLCFDKTGTLTAGKISLQRVSVGRGDVAMDDLGPETSYVLTAALRASPDPEDEIVHATDRAVIEGVNQANNTKSRDGSTQSQNTQSQKDWEPLGELAFEPARGYHAALGRDPLRGHVLAVKGAPEAVLPRCLTWRSPRGPVRLTRSSRQALEQEAERMASQGLRVLAVAERNIEPPETREPGELEEKHVESLELLGFLGLADSVRPSAAQALSELREAGVDVVMITGDHPATARAIANELGIMKDKGILTGPEIEQMSDAELTEQVGQVGVFARVTPAHKQRIVRALQRSGKTVAMTGDGANDAPAIRMAHTGIALGKHSSPAARAAADLIVLDDRIETIIDAIVEGRAMWASVREAVAILVGGNLGEVGFTLATTAISGASPLGPRQFLLVNMLTDLLPAMTITLRPPSKRTPEEILREGPDASLGTMLTRRIALRALVTGATATSAWALARATGSGRRASTVALVSLVGTQLGQTAMVGGASPLVLGSTAISAGTLAAIVQTPGVSEFFGCRPMGPLGWTIAGSTALGGTLTAFVLERLI